MQEVTWADVKNQVESTEDAALASNEVVGMRLEDATNLLSDRGLVFRVVNPGEVLSMDFVGNRVNLHLKDAVVERAELG